MHSTDSIRSTVRDCKKEEDGTPMGFVFTVESGFRVQRSSISPLILRTKFIDPDYTITFIRGDETYASYVIKNEDYSMGGACTDRCR
jgi:hypothetical protein